MRCKCVCKELLDLLMTPEFVKSHLSQAIPGGLVFIERNSQKNPYEIVEFPEINLDVIGDECRWGVVLTFNLPFNVLVPVHSSVNGLLFWIRVFCTNETSVSICNPITRECIQLPRPQHRTPVYGPRYEHEAYGFGVSRISGQYKVVWMYLQERKLELDTPMLKHEYLFECQVYTVGTGSWRRIAASSLANCQGNGIAAILLKGNLHWMSFDVKSVSCFDLETELVNAVFSTPPFDHPFSTRNLSVLRDCLCLCDNGEDEIGIWLMKEYGDHKSWTKEFVIREVHRSDFLGRLYPVKVFEDGDILIECPPDHQLLYYSNKTKTVRNINIVLGLDCNHLISAAFYTPSFVPLKTTFPMENVISFSS